MYLIGLLYPNTRTSCVSCALLCAGMSHDTLRRVLSQQGPWSRRLWDFFAQGLVQMGGYVVIDDTSWEWFTPVADAVSWVWSSRVGKPVWGMQVVLVLWTQGKWKVPLGMRIWHKGGPSKVAWAIGLLCQARRRGRQPASVLCDSWYAAGEILNLLDGWGWPSGMRLKRNRKVEAQALRTTWPQRQQIEETFRVLKQEFDLGQLFMPKTLSAVGAFTLRIICAGVNPTERLCPWADDLRVPTVVISPLHSAKSFGPTGVCPGCVISAWSSVLKGH